MKVLRPLLVLACLLLIASCSDNSEESNATSTRPDQSPYASFVAGLGAIEGLDFAPLPPTYLPSGLSWDAEVAVLDPRALHLRFLQDGTSKPSATEGLLEVDIQEEFDPDGYKCVQCPEEDYTDITIDGRPAQETVAHFPGLDDSPGVLVYDVIFRVGDLFITVSADSSEDTPQADAGLRSLVQDVAKSMMQ
ncbi:MAG TPA: hypothetical protein VLS25_06375 [Dehalococcoidia bacterium]|nr:hypothetical protein [Dehalococcoidia bacterium]